MACPFSLSERSFIAYYFSGDIFIFTTAENSHMSSLKKGSARNSHLRVDRISVSIQLSLAPTRPQPTSSLTTYLHISKSDFSYRQTKTSEDGPNRRGDRQTVALIQALSMIEFYLEVVRPSNFKEIIQHILLVELSLR